MTLIYKLREINTVSDENELAQAVINNLVVYFDNLPKKFRYDIKIVSSVHLADGSKVDGGSQRIQVGTYPTGGAKYKTVVNKFAIMAISQETEGGRVKKIENILVAPIDILSYNPTLADARDFSERLPRILSGSSLPIKTGLETGTIDETPMAPPEPEAGEVLFPFILKSGYHVFQNFKDKGGANGGGWRIDNGNRTEVLANDEEHDIFTGKVRAYTPDTAPVVSSDTPAPYTSAGFLWPGREATTLNEWYRAYEREKPSVIDRGLLYQSLGLGPRGTYIASAEQNINLLAKLQRK